MRSPTPQYLLFRAAEATGHRPARALACIAAAALHAAACAAGDAQVFRYHARPGDTLIGLGQRMLVRPADWPKLQRLNRIANPRRIPIGAEIRIPVPLMKGRPVDGRIVDVSGEAWVDVGPTAGPQPAQEGNVLAVGSQIRTGDAGYVTVRLADGSLLRVQASTQTVLERSLHYAPAGFYSSKLQLLRGRIEAMVEHLTGGEPRFQVQTPQALLGVRGTEFRITADPEHNETRTEVLSGIVGFGTRAPLNLAAGYGAKADAGRTTTEALPLPAAPDLSALPALHERILVRVPLPLVAGATAYRGQLAQDAAFQKVRGEARSTQPELKFAGLADGDYYLRVRVANAQGLEGRDAVTHLRLKARPEPPLLSQPVPRAKIRGSQVQLAWSRNPDAQSYHVQVAGDPGFQTLVRDEPHVADVALALTLPVGIYHWRVASVGPHDDHGPLLDAQSFSVLPLPAQPGPPQISDGAVRFAWAAEPGQTFEFQLARDAAFTQAVSTQTLSTPAVELPRQESAPEPAASQGGMRKVEAPYLLMAGGRFYVRYRAIDADGFVGPYTSPQTFDLPACLQDRSGACVRDGSGKPVRAS